MLAAISCAFFAPGLSAAFEPAAIDAPPVAELKRMSLEELLALEVTTASRRPERYSTTASALTVLTAEDIRRSGATTLADLLREPTGLQVARVNGTTWAIGARGFNLSLSNKLLVLLDGRSLYTPLYAGVFWDAQDTLLEDLDRVEVVRGPGATLWGGNAVNGVINIQTKNARDTQGTLVALSAGTADTHAESVRQGVQLSRHVFARAYAKNVYRDDLVRGDGSDAGDDWKMHQAGFRLDAEPQGDGPQYTAQGDFYHGFLGTAGSPDTRIAGWNLLGRAVVPLSGDASWRTQAYVDHVERSIPTSFSERRNTVDLDSQFNTVWGTTRRHHFVAGMNLRFSSDNTGDQRRIVFDPGRRTIRVLSGFIQDEAAFLDDRLGVSLGAKFEHHSSVGLEFQPSVRAAWHPDELQTLWGAVSRAVRTPTRLEDDVRLLSASGATAFAGNTDFDSEHVTAFEIGYRVHPQPMWAIDLSTFYNLYDRVRSIERPAGGPQTFGNALNFHTYGAELSVMVELRRNWRLRAMYTALHEDWDLDPGSTDAVGGRFEGNDPSQTLTVVSQLDLGAAWELDATGRYVASLPSPYVPAYTAFDLRLAWTPNPKLELSLVGRNLFDPRHPEFGPVNPTTTEVPRSFQAKITCRF